MGNANADAVTQIATGCSTTTYGYDAFGQRVLQTGTTTTYHHSEQSVGSV
jgi:YD repeat-containing protein